MFSIKVRSPRKDHRVQVYTDIALKRGQAVMADPADTTYATDRPYNPTPKIKLGDDTKVLGLVTRDANSTGASLEDRLNPWPIGTNNNRSSTAEIPDKIPGYVGLEPLPDEIEVEETLPGNASFANDHLITSGTGAVNTSTALNTELAYNTGKLRVKQSGEVAVYVVTAQLSPESGPAGGTDYVRIRARRVGA